MHDSAREDRAGAFSDQIISTADDASGDWNIDPTTGAKVFDHEAVARARLQVNARKWVAATVNPRVYGDTGSSS